jgi:hypothetical protein
VLIVAKVERIVDVTVRILSIEDIVRIVRMVRIVRKVEGILGNMGHHASIFSGKK